MIITWANKQMFN